MPKASAAKKIQHAKRRDHAPAEPKASKPHKTRAEGEARSEKSAPGPRQTADMFGATPDGATHFTMRKMRDDGATSRCYVDQKGVAVERFPLAMLSAERLRQVWGPGLYKGQWIGRDRDGSYKPLGRMREVKILAVPGHGKPARLRVVAAERDEFGFIEQQPARMHEPEPTEVVDARVKAEREISKMRIDAEREIFEKKLELARLDSENRIGALEHRLDELDEDDDDEDDEPAPAPPAGPWDWLAVSLRPIVEQVLPKLVPELVKKLTGAK